MNKPRRLATLGIPLIALCAMIASGCDANPKPDISSAPAVKNTCARSDLLVPKCGVWWGIATQPQTPETVAAAQSDVDRRFDLLYLYHDITATIPTRDERQLARGGQILHLAIAARVYGGGHEHVTYAGIAAGRYDSYLRRQGAGIASLRVPVFLTFEQEANQHDKLDVRGTAAEFIAAWRHIHDVYREAGATNAVWVWVMTGAPENLSRAATIWPGNQYVDWISWNVYNMSGCGSGTVQPDQFTSFEQALSPFYHWVHTEGPGIGMDPDKPMMISETGSVFYPDDPEKTADWYRAIPHVLRKYPQVKAVALWDSLTSPACDFRFQRSDSVIAAVRAVGISPIVLGH